MPKPLDIAVFAEPAAAERPEKPWPSREPREARAGAITIRTDSDAQVLERFKALCRDDRRTYTAMLDILMNAFEGKGQGGG